MLDRLTGLLKQLRALVRKTEVERELGEEVRFHLDKEAERLVREDGISGAEARRRAAIAFGGVERYKEAVRDVRWTRWLEDFAKDTRFATRALRKHPASSVAAVVTLALGIGALTAVYSVVNAVLLRPFPVVDQSRVVVLWKEYPQRELDRYPFTAAELRHWRDEAERVEDVAGVNYESPRPFAWRLGPGVDPERLPSTPVSHGFFSVLGVEPLLGRGFRPEDGQRSAEPVVILSHGVWQTRFGADRDVIGRPIFTPDGRPITVVGVAPPGFEYPHGTAMWVSAGGLVETTPFFHAVGRLRAHATPEAVRAEMQRLVERFAAEQGGRPANPRIVAQPLAETVVGEVRPALLILLGAVGLLILLGCVNVTNLLLVQATTRKREFAVRAALGAGQTRIVRQLLTESLLIALIGGTLGVLLAWWGTGLVIALMPEDIPRAGAIIVDGSVVGVALFTSLAAALAFGFALSRQVRGPGRTVALEQGGNRSAASRSGRRSRRVLVVGQIAMALVLLMGAGLLIQSFVRQLNVDRGFRTENLLVALVTPSSSRYSQMAQRLAFFERLTSRLERLPGVRAARPVLNPPAGAARGSYSIGVALEGQTAEEAARNPQVDYEAVARDHFRVLGIPLLRGRAFAAADREDALKVAIVNEAMVERLWLREDPIGKRVRLGRAEDGPWHTVVGVAGDVHYRNVTSGHPTVFVPLPQAFATPNFLLIRTAARPATIVPAVRRVIRALDSDIPLDRIAPLDEHSFAALARPRFNAVLLSLFALMALGLTGAGVYGVVASFVGERTREIGIRKALGARKGQLLRLVLGEGATLIGFGLVLGLLAALAVTRVLASLLYGVSATDPVTFIGVALILATVALLASYLPARRASNVDPMTTLRCE